MNAYLPFSFVKIILKKSFFIFHYLYLRILILGPSPPPLCCDPLSLPVLHLPHLTHLHLLDLLDLLDLVQTLGFVHLLACYKVLG